MNYQKLTKALLRVMAVWILIQGIQDFVTAFRTISEYSSQAENMNAFVIYAILPGATLMAMVIVLFVTSDKLSKLIADQS